MRFLWDFSVHSFLPQALVTLGVYERGGGGVFGRPLKASDGLTALRPQDFTVELPVPAFVQMHQWWVGINLLGYGREEWVLPLSHLWVPIEVGIDEVTASPEVLP